MAFLIRMRRRIRWKERAARSRQRRSRLAPVSAATSRTRVRTVSSVFRWASASLRNSSSVLCTLLRISTSTSQISTV